MKDFAREEVSTGKSEQVKGGSGIKASGGADRDASAIPGDDEDSKGGPCGLPRKCEIL